MSDPVCHSKACAEHGCKRSQHRATFNPPAWIFGACYAHRACDGFETTEPLDDPLPPLLPMRSPDGTERAGWPEESALVPLQGISPQTARRMVESALPPETAPLEERPAPIETDPLIAELRRRRQGKGLSQTAVAEMAGVGLKAISDPECGRGGTTLHTLRGWTRALGLELVTREVE